MDPITDLLNRIRNAQAVSKEQVSVPFSNLKYEIAKILERRGFVKEVGKKGKAQRRVIEITLKYDERKLAEGEARQGRPAISGLKRISKPGQRIYLSVKELKPVKSGYGITIISTSKGLMTDKEARRQRLGGEVLCEIW